MTDHGVEPVRLDTGSKVPLYQQIFVILRNKIISGELVAGHTIMGEREVCEVYGVSRITARRALNELAVSGLVERRRGQGTRVAAQPEPQPMVTSLSGLFENVGHLGRATDVRVLRSGPVQAGHEVGAALGVAAQAQVIRAVRVRDLDGAPICYVMTWVPEDVGALIAGQDMSRTPLLLLLEEAGVAVDAARQTITANIADPEVAAALSIPAGAPLIEVRRCVHDASGRPVEYIKVLYRPEFYRFEVSMRRVEGDVGRQWSAEDRIDLNGPAGRQEFGG